MTEDEQNPHSALNEHLRDVISWHFSAQTGTPYWRTWASEHDFNATEQIQTVSDLHKFGHMRPQDLRNIPLADLIPVGFEHRPYRVFETGGTTGRPIQRPSWDDHNRDYEAFSIKMPEDAFPTGSSWLMLGPTGPRRLRLTIEILANLRRGPCYHVDLDARWVKERTRQGRYEEVDDYIDHALDQAEAILEHTKIGCLFTTPRLLEALGRRRDLSQSGITGVMCGGTSMSPQSVRYLVEEVLGPKILLFPTYGNTLMGVAPSLPLNIESGFSLRYYPPLPRALLRIVDPKKPTKVVDYGERGQVELTTLTREFFLPGFLERDEATRLEPCALYPWDGVADVTPLKTSGASIVEGVY